MSYDVEKSMEKYRDIVSRNIKYLPNSNLTEWTIKGKAYTIHGPFRKCRSCGQFYFPEDAHTCQSTTAGEL